MNTSSPLVPQGSLPPKGKSTVKIFFTIVGIHVVAVIGVGVLLMQGCSKDKTPIKTAEETNNIAPSADIAPADPTTGNGIAVSAPASNNVAAISTGPATGSTAIPTPLVPEIKEVKPVEPTAKEYAVAKGDMLATIAKKNGVTLKALQDANPGVDPKKLQIGQKLQIPASAPSATAAVSPAAGAEATADSSVYIVKQGDVLERIAKKNGTKVKAIMALNNLKSANSLKPGQKLKMPAAKPAAAAPAETAPAPAAAAISTAPTTVATAAPTTRNP